MARSRGLNAAKLRRRGKYKKAFATKLRLTPVRKVGEVIMLENGYKCNKEESIIYRALERLHANFQAQVPLGAKNQIGSSLVDFVLPDQKIAIEHQTVWHDTLKGKSKDFTRRLNRKKAGLDTVYTYTHDLPHIDDVLRKIIGNPTAAVLLTRGSNPR